MKTIKLFLLLTTLAATSLRVVGAPFIQETKPWSLLQIGIVPETVALVSSDTQILGINAELFYGTQRKVGILDVQPIVGKTEAARGILYQGIGINGETIGLHIGLGTFQRYFCGVNVALATGAWENHGLQIGLANFSGASTPFCDTQENPPEARGVQVGLFNSTTNGFQFGLLNYNEESPIPWMVFFNYSVR